MNSTPLPTSGHARRMSRLSRAGDGRHLIVPMDHFVTDGPSSEVADLPGLVHTLAASGVDAIVVHKGSAREVPAEAVQKMGLIIHLSASTMHAPDPDAKYLVATVEEAIRVGADAVSVHVNLGCATERQQISDMAQVADACGRWGMPLLAMIYPRGPQILDPKDPVLVAHAARLGADLGADIVKVPACRDSEAMRDVVSSCPVPVITAGGALQNSTAALVADVEANLRAGTAGVAMGRNVFLAPDPGATARALANAIHHPDPLEAVAPRVSEVLVTA